MKTLRYSLFLAAFLGLLNLGNACDTPIPNTQEAPTTKPQDQPDDEVPAPEPSPEAEEPAPATKIPEQPGPTEEKRVRLDHELEKLIQEQDFFAYEKYDFAYDAKYLPEEGIDTNKTKPLQFAIGFRLDSDDNKPELVILAPITKSDYDKFLFSGPGELPQLPVQEIIEAEVIPNKKINKLPVIDKDDDELTGFEYEDISLVGSYNWELGKTKFYPRAFKIFDELLKNITTEKPNKSEPAKKPSSLLEDIKTGIKLKPVGEQVVEEKELTQEEKDAKAAKDKLEKIKEASSPTKEQIKLEEEADEDFWDDDDDTEPETKPRFPAIKPAKTKDTKPAKPEENKKKPDLKQPIEKPLPAIKPAKKPQDQKSKFDKLKDLWEQKK